jgi:hypothetical protein
MVREALAKGMASFSLEGGGRAMRLRRSALVLVTGAAMVSAGLLLHPGTAAASPAVDRGSAAVRQRRPPRRYLANPRST